MPGIPPAFFYPKNAKEGQKIWKSSFAKSIFQPGNEKKSNFSLAIDQGN